LFNNINDQNGYRIEFRYSHEKDVEEAFLTEEKRKDEKKEDNSFSLDMIKSKIGLSSYIMKGSKKLKPKEVLLNKSLNDFVENKIKYYYRNFEIINKDLKQSINPISECKEEIDQNIIKNNSNIILNEKIEKINKDKVKEENIIINKKKRSKFDNTRIDKDLLKFKNRHLNKKMTQKLDEFINCNLNKKKNKLKSNKNNVDLTYLKK